MKTSADDIQFFSVFRKTAPPRSVGYGMLRSALSLLSLLSLLFLPSSVSAQTRLKFTPPVFPAPSQTIPIPSPTERTTVPFDRSYAVPPVEQVSPSTIPSFSSSPLPGSDGTLQPISDLGNLRFYSPETLSPPELTAPRLLPAETLDALGERSNIDFPTNFGTSVQPGLQKIPLPLPPAIDRNELNEMLQVGRQLETESRWSDALTYYETAMKIYRNDEDLKQRFRVARFHYDLGRRFNDSSYLDLIQSTGFVDSLALYDEIVSRIQANYVDLLDWDAVFRCGFQDVEIALNNPVFRGKANIEQSREQVDAFVDSMRKTAEGWEIRNREDLKNGILYIAEQAMKRLNMNPVVLLTEFTCGMVNSLDPYTAYLTPNQLNDTYSMISGNLVGLGVEVKSDRESLLIVRVIEGSPAREAGLRDGDRIHLIDGISTKGRDTDNAADLLQGKEGTSLSLVIQHAGERQRREVRVVRRKIDVPSVEDVRMLEDGLGYVKLTGFQSKTCTELRNALIRLDQQGMQRLVLDLRHNPGGLLQVGVEVANLFLDEGVIVRTRGRHNSMDTPYMATKGNTWKMPLIVLIDEESASASEIVAGAIRDHGRGRIIGTRSYGKGTIQAILPVGGGQTKASSVGLRLTVEKFYSPLGWPYSGYGVEPHIKVESPKRMSLARQIGGKIHIPIISRTVSSSPEDPFIRKAIETARTMRNDLPGTNTASRN